MINFDITCLVLQEGDIHSLCIPEVFYEDAGQFTVKAQNPGGQTQATAKLAVQGMLTMLTFYIMK